MLYMAVDAGERGGEGHKFDQRCQVVYGDMEQSKERKVTYRHVIVSSNECISLAHWACQHSTNTKISNLHLSFVIY